MGNEVTQAAATQSDGAREGDDGERFRVFLSYSRRDAEFTARLAATLEQRRYLPDFDRSTRDQYGVETGISAEDDWWKRLQDMIARADVMIFVVSPDSAESRVCDEEIAYARSLGKRVIAILWREIDFSKAPPRLAALNVKISFVEAGAFDQAAEALATALDRDVAWLREQTRLTLAAKAWETSGKLDELLLRGSVIGDAEAWSARRPAAAPQVSELVLSFLAESRRSQTAREDAERLSLQRQRRLQRWVGGMVAIALVVALIGGWSVLQGQRGLARSQSGFLAAEAASEFEAGNYDRALRLGVLASRDTWRTPSANEAFFELARAAEYSRATLYLPADAKGAQCVEVSPDGKTIVAIRNDAVQVFIGDAGSWLGQNTGDTLKYPTCPDFAPNGQILVGAGPDNETATWTRGEAGWLRQTLDGPDSKPILEARFVSDTTLLIRRVSSVVVWRRSAAGDWKAVRPIYPTPLQVPATRTRAMFGASASADGRYIAIEMASAEGDPILEVWTEGRDGEWLPHAIDLPQDVTLSRYQLSPDGARLLVVTIDARIFEPDRSGAWRLVAVADEGGLLVNDANFDSDSEGNQSLVIAAGNILRRAMLPKRFGASVRKLRSEPILEVANGPFQVLERSSGEGSYTFAGKYLMALDGWRTVIDQVGVDSSRVGDVSQSADGRTLAIAGKDNSVRVWRFTDSAFSSGPVLAKGSISVNASAFAPEVGLVAASVESKEGAAIKLWRQQGSSWQEETIARPQDAPFNISVSASGRILTDDGPRLLLLAQDETNQWNGTYVGDAAAQLPHVEWSPDGKIILTVDRSDVMRIWRETADGWVSERVGNEETIAQAAAFLPDGSVAAFDRGVVQIWRAANGRWTETIVDGAAGDYGHALGVSHDGRRLAAAGNDGAVVWTRGPGERWQKSIVTQEGDTADRLEFSPDGRLLVTAPIASVSHLWAQRDDGQWFSLDFGYDETIARNFHGFSRDGTSALLTSGNTIRLADVSWFTGGAGWEAGRARAFRDLVARACREKLGAQNGTTLSPGSYGLQHISADDIAAAPVLLGREGEDVCTWRPVWYDDVLSFLFGWLG